MTPHDRRVPPAGAHGAQPQESGPGPDIRAMLAAGATPREIHHAVQLAALEQLKARRDAGELNCGHCGQPSAIVVNAEGHAVGLRCPQRGPG